MSHAKTDGIPEGWRAPNGMHVLTSVADPVFKAFAAYDRLVVELFAGPGGMSEAMKLAGLPERTIIGVEWDASACMTAVSAGHPRLHADLAKLHPSLFGKVWGLHGSPPCQGFSPAGKGEGRHDMRLLVNACKAMARGDNPDTVMAILREHVRDDKSPLALEPLRWALDLRPEWITLEQVAAVQPLWDEVARTLRARGYNVWTGVVSSEQYGVPQTRRRAVLMASLTVDVSAGLTPTHSRFYTHKSKRGQLDEGVLPYVTMGDALGLDATARVVSNYGTGGDPAARGERTGEEPAAAVTSKVGRNRIVGARVLNSDPKPQQRTIAEPSFTVTGGGRNVGFEFTHMGDVRNAHGCVRAVDEPAPTLTSSMDNGNFRFVYRASNQEHAARRRLDEPAPTVVMGARVNKVEWMPEELADDVAARGVPVTVAEAGILQSFPADYPWQGNKTKQYEQVGNAVPPRLGQAMVETTLGIRAAKEQAA